MVNSARFLKEHELCTGSLGVTGFCWGGSTTNHLAVTLGKELQAGAPFYGSGPDPAQVGKIRAAMLIHCAENDQRVNATRDGYETALKTAGTAYQMHTYPGCGHGFHNNSTTRYVESAANLAWERTMAWFHEHVG